MFTFLKCIACRYVIVAILALWEGGDRRFWTSRFPYPAPPVPAPFRSGSRLRLLFLLRYIVPMLRIFFCFSRLSPLLDIPPPSPSSSASCRPPTPITPGYPPPCPPTPHALGTRPVESRLVEFRDAFLWDDLDQDQWSKIIRIMLHEGIAESLHRVDSVVPLMRHDSGDLGSLIMIWIILKENAPLIFEDQLA